MKKRPKRSFKEGFTTKIKTSSTDRRRDKLSRDKDQRSLPEGRNLSATPTIFHVKGGIG